MSEHMSIGETGQGFTGNMWVLENISSGDIAGFWCEGGGQIDASKTVSVL